MAITPVAGTRIRVSETEAGTYVNVGQVRSFEMIEGSEGDTTIKWFGGDSSRPGDATLTGTMPVWWDRDDTTGQEALRAAKRAGTPVWLQFAPNGTEAGAVVDQFEAIITEVRTASDSEGEAVEGSFSYRGTPSSLEEVTLA